MKINWLVVAQIAGPILAAILLAYIARAIERRPRLITWLVHAAAIPLQAPGGQQFTVHTHAIIVRNTGKRSATNVRLGHDQFPPNFSVYPAVNYTKSRTPGGGTEIVFPTMVPDEQLTVTYLYYPPMTWYQINTYAKSDEGSARALTMLPTPQLTPWVRWAVWALLFLGVVDVIYLIVQFVLWLFSRF